MRRPPRAMLNTLVIWHPLTSQILVKCSFNSGNKVKDGFIFPHHVILAMSFADISNSSIVLNIVQSIPSNLECSAFVRFFKVMLQWLLQVCSVLFLAQQQLIIVHQSLKIVGFYQLDIYI
ncbi:hypothetical protein FGO68_gene12888 [Halteria grandinella]|uniref:Uncharacterized protein n=1 Tax=Halteria grandinella TaxID=5974 RepID=A0A8J8NGW9_HALGN|nr:hypothetical protein FGO68_gene12888 [Halteria grandinella]